MFSLILLSAGLSSRFGCPKALATWNSKPLITQTLDRLLSTDLDEIIVVLGAFADEIKPVLLNHNKIKVVYNKDYKFGQTSSLQRGLSALSPSVKAFGLLPIDFPLIKAQSIDTLIAEFRKTEPLILIPTYQDKKGHPPFFNVTLKNEILQLSNDVGLNTVVHHHDKDIRLCELNDEGILCSFNTPEELERLRVKFI